MARSKRAIVVSEPVRSEFGCGDPQQTHPKTAPIGRID